MPFRLHRNCEDVDQPKLSLHTIAKSLLFAESRIEKKHLLLMYTLAPMLSRTTEPMTCRELVQQIQTQYAGSGRSAPTPMIAGRDRDREVFGLNVWPDRSRILLAKKGRGWTINAGLLQGVTPGSVFSVLRSAEAKARAQGAYVRAQVVRTMDAEGVVCDEQRKVLSTALPEKGRCE